MMTIIYLPLYERGFPVLKKQKRGLREALEKQGEVIEVDWAAEVHKSGREGFLQKMQQIAVELDPSLVLGQFHDARLINADDILSLRKFSKKAIWLNWNGDYQEVTALDQADIDLASAFDLQLGVSYDGAEEYEKRGIRSRYWQIGWEQEGVGYEPDWLTPHHDVLFLANKIAWYPARQEIVSFLRRADFKFGLYGLNWPWLWAKGSCLYDFRKGCKLIRAAKVVLADNPRPQARGYVSNRLFQSLAAGGALVMMQYFHDYETLGLIDGEHLVIWHELNDLREKLNYWLHPKNEDQRRAIAAAGQKFCLENHSFEVRVQELLQMLAELG
jgi:hypothetical protein